MSCAQVPEDVTIALPGPLSPISRLGISVDNSPPSRQHTDSGRGVQEVILSDSSNLESASHLQSPLLLSADHPTHRRENTAVGNPARQNEKNCYNFTFRGSDESSSTHEESYQGAAYQSSGSPTQQPPCNENDRTIETIASTAAPSVSQINSGGDPPSGPQSP
ncbi:hypothetical protein, conserved [Angomonas deanei]|uniref:Uncharacterized protein n=1 Tax=Angomonas deanei TaxID=59799 RepID=A0A7G2CQP0_9TRYP|nr:hypothetical protein, conserved [Angomonas deanei]